MEKNYIFIFTTFEVKFGFNISFRMDLAINPKLC